MAAPDLLDVIADLKRRLGEAEETLRAIREGEVDALVIRGKDAEEVFSITGEDEAYRGFMESMELGAAALDDGGRVLYANAAMLALLDRPLEAIQGYRLAEALGPGQDEALARVLADGGTTRPGATTIRGADGRVRHLVMTAAPLRIGTISGHAVTFTDVTARILAESEERGERIARAVIASANEAMVVCDKDGRITHANAAAAAIGQAELTGRPFADAMPLIVQGGTGLLQVDELIGMALEGKPVRGVEVLAPEGFSLRDFLLSVAPLKTSEERIAGCVVTLTDLSHRKSAEKHQQLLMAELDHRVKNVLALVLAISRKMSRTSQSMEGFHSAFADRIGALAATHTLLAAKAWRGLSLRDIMVTELAPYLDTNSAKFSFAGLDKEIPARAAIALGLVVHELVTNAVKYGALSTGAGRIAVEARLGRVDETILEIDWRESGGPDVAAPKRVGFGSTVITKSLQYAPGGGAEVDYAASGLICRMKVPLNVQ